MSTHHYKLYYLSKNCQMFQTFSWQNLWRYCQGPLTMSLLSLDLWHQFHFANVKVSVRKYVICKGNSMFIVNGRVGNDKNIGRFTCRNASVVDYCITSPYCQGPLTMSLLSLDLWHQFHFANVKVSVRKYVIFLRLRFLKICYLLIFPWFYFSFRVIRLIWSAIVVNKRLYIDFLFSIWQEIYLKQMWLTVIGWNCATW
jgi:hypothetical protein